MWVTSSTAKVLKPNALALGNFDGIHRGHQRVLQPILKPSRSKIGDPPAINGKKEQPDRIYSTVVTFNPHPRQFFSGQSRKLLTPLQEKVKLLESLGIEQLVLLPFDRQLASLSPQQFVEDILVGQLQASKVSVGEDFCFGRDRQGTSADLAAIGAKFGVEVIVTSLQQCSQQGSEDMVRISSSSIRKALERGELNKVKQMLGRSYSLIGTVITGEKLGRKIGFPTANLQLPTGKFLPCQGVYSVRVWIEELAENPENNPCDSQSPIEGVMNIGCRPTVGGNTPTVEVHLLDWSGDLYGKTLRVNLEQFLRPEQKFPSLEALKAQIAADCQAAREISGV